MIEQMYYRLELPFPDNKMEIYTDGNDDYTHVLAEYYAHTCMDYGQMIKVRKGGRVVDKIKRVVYGLPKPDNIETTNIENFNGIVRERNGRFVRKTKCFSKRKRKAWCGLQVLQFYWNFMKPIRQGATPAMLEQLDSKQWTWHDFLMFHFAV